MNPFSPKIVGPDFKLPSNDNNTDDTRERYLEKAVDLIVTRVFDPVNVYQFAETNSFPKIKVSCSWALGTTKAIGTCHPRSHSACGQVNQLTISPAKGETDILGILIHEMIHALDNCKNGHGPIFKKMALSVGLTGKMTATKPGPKLQSILDQITEELGTYPHSILSAGQKAGKKQKNRMIKVECNDCGLVFRLAKTNIRGRHLRCADTACGNVNLTINNDKPI